MQLNNLKLNIVFLCGLCGKVVFPRLSSETHAKKLFYEKQSQFPSGRGETQRRRIPKNLFSRNEPNLNKETSALTVETIKNYSKLLCNGRRKNEPNLNPFEPKTNPIRTQFEPNTNPNKPNYRSTAPSPKPPFLSKKRVL